MHSATQESPGIAWDAVAVYPQAESSYDTRLAGPLTQPPNPQNQSNELHPPISVKDALKNRLPYRSLLISHFSSAQQNEAR